MIIYLFLTQKRKRSSITVKANIPFELHRCSWISENSTYVKQRGDGSHFVTPNLLSKYEGTL